MARMLSETDAKGRSGTMILIGAGCAAFMNILDGTIVTVSLPTITQDLAVDTGFGVAVLLAYTVMLAGAVLPMGRTADRWGIRRLMMAGFALFTASSLVCGLAPSFPVLVFGRLLQGIGGGMLSATSLAAVGYYFPPESRGRGIGMVSAASAVGAALGAPLGGFLSEFLGWRFIFLVNIPVGVAAFWIVSRYFPADPSSLSLPPPGYCGPSRHRAQRRRAGRLPDRAQPGGDHWMVLTLHCGWLCPCGRVAGRLHRSGTPLFRPAFGS